MQSILPLAPLTPPLTPASSNDNIHPDSPQEPISPSQPRSWPRLHMLDSPLASSRMRHISNAHQIDQSGDPLLSPTKPLHLHLDALDGHDADDFQSIPAFFGLSFPTSDAAAKNIVTRFLLVREVRTSFRWQFEFFRIPC